jgi:hypothetical protein
MTNSPVFSPPLSHGQIVPSSAFNALDAGQQNALTRSGTTPLTANTKIQGNGYAFTLDVSDNAASFGQFKNGDSDFAFNATGSGKYTFPADKLHLLGTSYPPMDTHAIADYAPPFSADWDRTGTVGHPVSLVFKPLLGLWSQVDYDGAPPGLAFLLGLPVGLVVKSVSVGLQKTDGSALPAVMPAVTLGYFDLASGAFVLLSGPKADSSSSLAAYKAHHLVTTDTITHTVAGGRRYVVLVTGDNTSNSGGDDLSIYSPSLSVELSTLGRI